MADVVNRATRSKMMAGIRSKNTSPEMALRKLVHGMGFRYKLHDKTLPGKPDMVFRSLRAVILVHGCFWHGHNCSLFKWPSSRPEFWRAKILGNRRRDSQVVRRLHADGWRILEVWECVFKGKSRWKEELIARRVSKWLISGRTDCELKGKK